MAVGDREGWQARGLRFVVLMSGIAAVSLLLISVFLSDGSRVAPERTIDFLRGASAAFLIVYGVSTAFYLVSGWKGRSGAAQSRS